MMPTCKTILLVEDSPTMQEFFRQKFDEWSHGRYRLMVADDFGSFTRMRHFADFIVMDILLPDASLSSMELVQKFRCGGVPYVFWSAAEDQHRLKLQNCYRKEDIGSVFGYIDEVFDRPAD